MDSTTDTLDAIRALTAGKYRGEVLSIRNDIAEDLTRLKAADVVRYETANSPIDSAQYPVGQTESHPAVERRQSELAYVDSLLESDGLKFAP